MTCPIARRSALALAAALLATSRSRPSWAEVEAVARAATQLLDPNPGIRANAILRLGASGDSGAVAPLIQFLFWAGEREQRSVVGALAALTGEQRETWFDWQVWQQQHTEIVPFAGYARWLGEVLARIDPLFRRFIGPSVAHAIRLEEVVWGGVKVDAIPALDRPRTTGAAAAGWLDPEDRVFGLEINGQARAYPQRIADWHEMVNDVLGGVALSLAYCTLCGAAIAFAGATRQGRAFTFGSSGLLYRSNKLMYDRQTDSLWNQFTGTPVVGAMTHSGIALDVLPIATTSWADWRRRHPGTTVLSNRTGFRRNYTPGAAYGGYFASPSLLFPADARDPARQKEVVFGVRAAGGIKTWPLARFAPPTVLNDRVGLIDVVLIGDAATGTVRAYESRGRLFAESGPDALRAPDGVWRITEGALLGPDARSLPRLPGHVGYRFAWEGYFGGNTD